MIKEHPVVAAFVNGRFSLLLISVALLFLVAPLFPADRIFANRMFGCMTLFVLGSCLRSIARSRRFFIFMVVLTLINVGLGSFEIFSSMDTRAFQAIVLGLRILYFGIIFFSIMSYVMDNSPVTGDKICGAVSAYMILGIAWTSVYALFFLLDPSSFNGVPQDAVTPGGTVNSGWALYFSFTSLTTLGYGDITPATTASRAYAVMEAAIGQIFLAVIVARLIALHITHERPE